VVVLLLLMVQQPELLQVDAYIALNKREWCT